MLELLLKDRKIVFFTFIDAVSPPENGRLFYQRTFFKNPETDSYIDGKIEISDEKTSDKEKEEDPKAFLCISALCLTQPRQPGPGGHCRYRKPCKLCGALRAHRTWGKPRRWERTASSWSHGAYRGGPWTLYT